MESHVENMEHTESKLALERVLADLKSLAHDAEDLIKATASDLSEKAKEARSRVSATLERARNTCSELQERSAATTRAVTKRADTVIRGHPYESLARIFHT